jgi:hypothetical protein
MKYLTGEQLDRQDLVDNAIQDLIERVTGNGVQSWSLENIGKLRDTLKDVIVNDIKAMPAQEFYPEVEYEPQDIPPKENIKPIVIAVNDRQLVDAVIEAVKSLDAEDFAYMAGEVLGGECEYTEDGVYAFYPDENYYGAFDYLLEEKADEKN